MTTPTWITVNSGLTATQYQNANFFFVTPNGAFYAGRCDTIQNSQRGINYYRSPWIARAPSVGATFTIIEDETTLWAKYPTYSTLDHAIKACAYNPLVPETVAYIMGEDTSTFGVGDFDIRIGSSGTYATGAHIADLVSHLGSRGLSYGQGSWVHTGPSAAFLNPAVRWTFDRTGSTLVSQANYGGISEHMHIRASTTGVLFSIGHSSGDIRKSTDNGLTWNFLGDTTLHSGDGMATDPAGLYLMARWGAGARGKSSDGGATWTGLPSLPVGTWWFAYAGGMGTSSQWIAAGGSSVRLSPDFGNTWTNYEGNLVSSPLALHIDGDSALKAPGYAG